VVCKLHGVQMQRRVSERTGGHYFSHRRGANDLCFGGPKKCSEGLGLTTSQPLIGWSVFQGWWQFRSDASRMREKRYGDTWRKS
jgi:hypothetical protein